MTMAEEQKPYVYVYVEYPKSLHVGGDRNAPERVVRDADEERAARAEGFKMIDKAHDAKSVADLGLEAPVEKAVEKKAAKK
jgi:hypothetical protein